IAGITDFIDGPVARMLKTESIFGSYLDRIRDRIFVYPTIVILAWHQRDKIIFPELLYCLMASLAVFEVLLFRIGAIGLWWHIKGINVNLLPNNWGKRKIFAGFVVVFIWLISLAIESLNIPCLKYSIWIIYLGLVLMVYWSHVSWKEYMERSKEARNKKAQNNF
ncbi:MAG: CDP-alcohol phosphatidyltransferase family protein, partial [bacterium]|nr:CDP-alcohol phosphatidyltransferase family protein [bacterium]